MSVEHETQLLLALGRAAALSILRKMEIVIMVLNPEWRRRIEQWRNYLPKIFYRPVAELPLEYFVTTESLRPAEASKRSFQAIEPGRTWGEEWQLGWFRGQISLPASLAGSRVVLKLETGGAESIIWVNGVARGARDHSGRELLLTASARGGEQFSILAECFAGNRRDRGGGPQPELFVPDTTPAPTVQLGRTSFGSWHEEAFQLWLDMETLLQLRDGILDPHSLRLAEIDEGLQQLTLLVDFELAEDARDASIRAGRELLRPLLACRNGSTAPRMHCFGHSHIDVAWLWPLAETERKCCRTFANQLALMEEYPEYKFLQSQAYLYRRTSELYPELYERVRAAVARGQWLVDGAMWVEADTNISGGEALIRQFVHGKRFYREEFGIDSELMWLPDVFGYSGALPQIMAGCGIKWFSTQKIFWTYNGGDPFPYNSFWWEGIDGTRVLSYLHNDYNSDTKPQAVLARWRERVQKDASHKTRLMPFGYGDGGGGPTRQHLEYLRRSGDLEGLPKCSIGEPADFFRQMPTAGLPCWVGELYFQAHRGTYTSQAKTKKGNRDNEMALRELECWGAIAKQLQGSAYPLAEVDELWKNVLLNQFHDIIPGSSIREVHVEAEELYAQTLARVRELTAATQSSLLKEDADALTVFNSLSWQRDAMVEIPFAAACDEEGRALPVQCLEGRNIALLRELPACGWITIRRSETPASTEPSALRATPGCLENALMAFSFNELGELCSARCKASGEEFLAAPANVLHLYKDVPSSYDAWDIDSMYKKTPCDFKRAATVTVLAQGPVFAALRITQSLHESELRQDIVLRAHSRVLEFRTVVEWRESHKMLKVAFPVAIRAEEALHEIQFGHLRRPTHATRPYDAARFEVCNHKWTALADEGRGAALLNDCKYGVNVEGNCINLTLLRSPLAPDPTADKGRQSFTYAFCCWQGPFLQDNPIRDAYELNVPASCSLGDGGRQELIQLSAPNIIVESIKPAEDGSADIVVRLYESARAMTNCELRIALPFCSLQATDMLEQNGQVLPAPDGVIALQFRAFEIKTLRLVMA
jgi:alpha-mannosidase